MLFHTTPNPTVTDCDCVVLYDLEVVRLPRILMYRILAPPYLNLVAHPTVTECVVLYDLDLYALPGS